MTGTNSESPARATPGSWVWRGRVTRGVSGPKPMVNPRLYHLFGPLGFRVQGLGFRV